MPLIHSLSRDAGIMNDNGQPAGAAANDGRWSADDLGQLRRALAGQYTIERELGRGGMGIVVLARDERLDRLVALKVLPPVLAQQPETRERFLREARMAAQLSHPNIVPVHRADDIGGFAFFAMGFVDGETLADRIRDRRALQPPEVVRVLREVAWALAYAHARGIVHRDIKPENILLERGTGRAVVTDFGIARADFNPSLTQDGYILGTVHYMSPEQSSGEAIDGRSDLYALGCVGFFALSGTLPFTGSSPQAILIAHATKEPPSLAAVAPDVPLALVNAIDRCLRKDPDARFATGEALADALEKALASVNQQSRESNASAVMSSDDAMAVWRRAAELQAEAAARLESRLRAAAEPRAVAGATSGATSGAASGEAQDQSDVAEVPTDAYRVRDVEAAAAEAGISQRYVALAMAELHASPNASLMVQSVPEWKDRLCTRLFGTEQRSMSVSRVFAHPPRVVLQALGNALQAAPWMLTLRDTLGGHPLDGGVLVFDIPAMIDGTYKWSYTRYGMFVPDLRVTLASLAGDPRSCEVTIQLDLRKGLNANLIGSSVLTVGGMFGGTVGGLVVGKAALALAGAALAGPAFGGAMLVGVAALALSGPGYRYAMRKSARELEDVLAAIDTSIRAVGIFGSPGKSGVPSKIPQY
ncbi:MAG: serine/threonine protein kinase [Gemmatimonadaceae bacterium]|nr:serine/threonine protein kinase [Gemmatimonadaceae bacterium]